MTKEPSDNENELRLVEEEAVRLEKDVIRLEAGEVKDKNFSQGERLRPSQPEMQKLVQEDVEIIHEKKKVADFGMEWLEEEGSLDEPASHRHMPLGWIVALAGVVLLLASWGAWRTLAVDTKDQSSGSAEVQPQSAEDDASRLNASERADLTKKERDEAELSYEQLEDVVSRYFKATKPEDYLGIIRDEERVMPLIREYHQTRPFVPREYRGIDEFHIIAVENHPMLGIRVNFADGEDCAALVEDAPNQVLMDWESERAHQPVDLPKFIVSRSTEAVDLRVYASPDHYYAYDFADESQFLSIKLTFRDSEEYLNGFIRRGTEAEKEIRASLRKVKNTICPLLLRVQYPEGGKGPRSVEVLELISQNWVYVQNKVDKKRESP